MHRSAPSGSAMPDGHGVWAIAFVSTSRMQGAAACPSCCQVPVAHGVSGGSVHISRSRSCTRSARLVPRPRGTWGLAGDPFTSRSQRSRSCTRSARLVLGAVARGLAGGSVHIHWLNRLATRLPGLILPTTGEALNRGVGAPEGTC